MQKKYKAGIIGLGNIGFRYTLDPLRTGASSHLEAYAKHPDFEPVAICDVNETNLRKAKSYLPSLNAYTSWKDMLENEGIDIVSVCVSPGLNLQVCESLSLDSVKAVILEKPFAQDIATGQRIIKALKAKNIIAAVNYFRRWQKAFWMVKEFIDANKIGKILKLNAFYPAGIWTGGSHIIDIIQYLLGNFKSIKTLSKVEIRQISGSLYSVFGYIGDIEIYLSGFDKRNFNIFDIEIWGKDGKIIICDFAKKIIIQQALRSKNFSKQKEIFTTEEITHRENPCFLNLLNNISAVLKRKEKQILCSPEDALKTTRVIVAIENSYAYKKEISLTGW